MVEILDGEETTGWWVHRRDAAVPGYLAEKKRQGVRVRELIFAFHTDAQGHCLRLRDAAIYAFLPTGLKPGLPFLVQADFLTTANRESIHGDSAWSKWLRDELAPAYLDAVRHGVRRASRFAGRSSRPCRCPARSAGVLQARGELDPRRGRAQAVFPGESGRLRPLGEVFRAEETLRRLFPSSALAELLGADVEYLDHRFQIPEVVPQWLEIPDAGSLLGSLLARHDWLSGATTPGSSTCTATSTIIPTTSTTTRSSRCRSSASKGDATSPPRRRRSISRRRRSGSSPTA